MAAQSLVTWVHDEGEFSRAIHYLLLDGRRRKVVIDAAHDSEDLRKRMGEALAVGRTGLGKGRR